MSSTSGEDTLLLSAKKLIESCDDSSNNIFQIDSHARSSLPLKSNMHSQQQSMSNVIEQLRKKHPISNGQNYDSSPLHQQAQSKITSSPTILPNYFDCYSMVSFNSINRPTPVLDNEPSKFKSSLIKRGSLASRHLPNHSNTSNRTDSTNTQNRVEDFSNLDDHSCENGNLVYNSTEIIQNTSRFKQFYQQQAIYQDVYKAATTGHQNSANKGYSYSSPVLLNSNMTNIQQSKNNIIGSNNNINNNKNNVSNNSMVNLPTTSTNTINSSNSSINNLLNYQYQQRQQAQQQQPHQSISSFNQPIEEWTCDVVAQWLAIIDLSAYIDAFVDKSIDGEKLILLDTSKLKALGIKSQKDREYIKSKVKELKFDEKKRFKLLLEQTNRKKKLKS
jgi:hypothetical protein